MYRHSEQTRASTPTPVIVALLALLLAVATLALTAIPAAAGGCTFVAAIAPGPDDEGSPTLTAEVGEPITFWGTFVPNATVELLFEHDGVPFGDFTPGNADVAGAFLFVHDFVEGQEGTWTVTAAVPETECAGTVEVIVAAAGAAPTPVASPAPALPDTALAQARAADGMGGPVTAVLMLMLAAAIVLRFRTWFRARSG